MTLLEVLIACGILVIGLASIAALLPAAGSRLSQAAMEDRAGNLAVNACTDAISRGLVAADLFSNANKSVAFGKGMATLPGMLGQHFAAASASLGQRIDPQRGFLLEDELLFAPPTTAETPANDFPDGRRAFKEGLCWGATLVPDSFPARAGTPAVLGIVVFRREGQAKAIPLTRFAAGLYRMVALNEDDMKKFLKGCSSVLVPSTDPAKGPRWFQITASWRPPIDPTTQQRKNDNCYVVFADPDFETFAGPEPIAIGFEAVVRSDQYNVILQ